IAGVVLSGLAASLADVPGNLLQAGVGIVIGIALFSAVRKAYPPLVRLGNLGVNAAADDAE
ncbi:MAG: ECF transporter S component, partial [Bifidobacteriaceae bacterium]|nr:ECF transporter S component [Bifidobacteriaceae bacterium]